jgi:hypothetical protein
MKCNKCGAEWKVDASKSASISVCPFCQEKLANEKSSGWQFFDNTKELLAFIAAEYGNDAIFQRKHLPDHSSPTLSQGQKNRVKQAYECGVVKILENNMTSEQARKETAVKQAVGKMVDAYGTADDIALQLVWEFTNALGWGMPEPQVKSTTKSGATAEEQPPITPPPPSSGVDSLMQLAAIGLQNSDWQEAEEYYKDVLKQSPQYALAWIGRLLVDLKLGKEDDLAMIPELETLSKHKFFQTALQFADATTKSRLDGYLQTIKDRIAAEQKAAAEAARRKQVQDAYDRACMIMDNAESPADYDKAIAALGNIDTAYQDISSQIKAKIAEGEKKKVEWEQKMGSILAPLRAHFDPKAKAEKQAALLAKKKEDEAKLIAENEKAKAAHEAEYQRSLNEYQANYEKWQAAVANIKAEQEAKLSSWQAEVNRIKAENDALHHRWQEEVAAVQTQSETWKSQGLCPHCGIGKIGFFGSCKECKRKGDEAITVPLPPGYIDYPPEPAMPYNMPAEPVKPQAIIFKPRQLDESLYLIKEDKKEQTGAKMRFNIAGIDWLVLDNQGGKVLLISEQVLEERPYHKEGGDITWEKCSLRKYLNDEFYNRLGAVKGAVAETRNIDSDNPWYGTRGGNSTTDKVFLLSLDEVVRYFGDSGDLKNKKRKNYDGKLESDGWYVHDRFNSARIAKDKKGAACWWWLRSPGYGSDRAAGVNYGGRVGVDGVFVYGDIGVRPALWLNL